MLILLLSSLLSCTPSDTKYNVYNTEPGASISSPVEGQAFDERSSVSFRGRVVDNQDVPSELYITWSSDLDGVLQEGRLADGDGNVSFVTANLSVGTHAITLTATDTASAQGFTSIGIVVEDVEDRPRVNILAPVGSDYGVEDLPYTLRAGVTDDQDAAAALLLIVTSDLEGELCRETPGADNIATCDVILGVGSHLLTFTAWDSGGNSAEATTYFPVIAETEHDFDGDGFTESLGDCDDTDDDRYPGASEVYDGVDQDCDNLIDESTVGFDDDGDLYSELDGDCDDDDKTVYPTAKEYCDGVDNDCDLSIDEGTSCVDDDGDGFTEDDGDCDDANGAVYPGATECYDGADNDCDFIVDEGTVGYDDDADLYTELDGDCDDADRSVYPGAKESCDGVDNDCDVTIDEGTSCFDDDSDGYTEDDGDCNDASAAVSPKATESCDSVDNNCDGSTDPAGSSGCTTYYLDGDGDGYGVSTSSSCLCAPSSTYKVTNSADCYDSNSKASPAQTGYFTADRGDGSYDYDCDGAEDQRYTTMGSCPTNILRCSADAVVGWKGSTPPKCGASRNMITRCSYDPTASLTTCTETTSATVQECQ